MNAYLDTLATSYGLGVRLAEGGRVSAVAHRETIAPPDVSFGCITETATPDGDCAVRGDSVLGRRGHTMRLAVARPSAAWIAWTRDLLHATGMERTLVITLEVGQYLPRQRGLLGKKEVELGTGHVVSLPWLTSLETPVSVLQLTGALVDADGRAVRIGAEGIHAHRTRLAVSAVGGVEVLSEEDVREVRAARREDVAGRPVGWRVALEGLVRGVVGVGR